MLKLTLAETNNRKIKIGFIVHLKLISNSNTAKKLNKKKNKENKKNKFSDIG
tara:strand:+ start:28 stop:183 length:156 start_codon:yes stop_codon:yes gene_type:complete